MSYIPDELLEKIEKHKRIWEYDNAINIVNGILAKDPLNKEALIQISDIEYRKWEIARAEKPIDFLIKFGKDKDPMWLYIKWVLEMEKTNWLEAKKYLKESLILTNFSNPEIIRCYWLTEFWSGNRERWFEFLQQAFDINKYDAEIIYNIIELKLLNHEFKAAENKIKYYYNNYEKIQIFDREKSFYDDKIKLFESYLKII
jgi:tetratricopeptide (TPR) repeat protein